MRRKKDRKQLEYINKIQEIDEKYYVFMLDENGVRYAQEVEIDAILGDKAIIKSGLEEGDKVIVTSASSGAEAAAGQRGSRPGMRLF